jgi:hypothetical protein
MAMLTAMSGMVDPGSSEPGQDALAAAEGGDHRGVDDGIEPVRLCLLPEQEAERGDDDHARGQHGPGPGSPGVPQQRPPAVPHRCLPRLGERARVPVHTATRGRT